MLMKQNVNNDVTKDSPISREQRGTLRALAVICHVTKVIFSFRKSVFQDVRTDYNLDLRFLVKFNEMADLS